jgi:hypothetical protein
MYKKELVDEYHKNATKIRKLQVKLAEVEAEILQVLRIA